MSVAPAGRSAPPPPLEGQVFNDRYLVESLIGQGGMAWVFRARHVYVQHEVALKVLHKSLADEEREIKRFYNEARALSRLSHPNTIKVHDFGCSEDGYLFIAMEYLRGKSLAAVLLEEGPLPVRRLALIGVQVCKSLDEAHEKGIVHRDLKPDNILLCTFHKETDWVKVIDFGIANLGGSDPATSAPEGVFGTPKYMAPEQVRGDPVTPAVDLYALGVVLYELATGRPPFEGPTRRDVLLQHLTTRAPALPERVDGRPIPAMLRNLVDQLLEKDPGWRPSSAEEVRERLAALVTPGRIQGPQAGVWTKERGSAGRTTAARATGQGPANDTGPASDTAEQAPPIEQPVAVDRAAPRSDPPLAERPALPAAPAARASAVAPDAAPAVPAAHAVAPPGVPPDALLSAALSAAEAVARAGLAEAAPGPAAEAPPHVAAALPITILSVPPGARLVEDGQTLGRTPLTVDIGWDECRTFTCALPGHMAKRFTLRATDGPAVKVTLRPAPTA